MDARSIWLGASICLMLVALVASLSRAGMAASAGAIILGAYLRGRRTGSPGVTWAVGAFGLAIVAGGHTGESVPRSSIDSAPPARPPPTGWRSGGRRSPVVKDFWLTGTGAGQFETVMLVYQRTPSLFRINAAHNHYLQVAAEGGR